MKYALTNFSFQLTCPFRFAHRNPTLSRRCILESFSDEFFPSILFFCSIRCFQCCMRQDKKKSIQRNRAQSGTTSKRTTTSKADLIYPYAQTRIVFIILRNLTMTKLCSKFQQFCKTFFPRTSLSARR